MTPACHSNCQCEPQDRVRVIKKGKRVNEGGGTLWSITEMQNKREEKRTTWRQKKKTTTTEIQKRTTATTGMRIETHRKHVLNQAERCPCHSKPRVCSGGMKRAREKITRKTLPKMVLLMVGARTSKIRPKKSRYSCLSTTPS